MTRNDFVKRLADILAEEPSSVTEETQLDSLSDWDSMGQMEIVSLLDEINAPSETGALEKCQKIADIVQLAGL